MLRRRAFKLGKQTVRMKLGQSRRRVDVVLDLCCGTATSASLYYLMKNKNAIVIGIDRDKSESWVRSHLKHLPVAMRSRFCFYNADVTTLTVSDLAELIRRSCRSARVSDIKRVHWSPPCETLSRATRGRSGYRDKLSRPCKAKSIAHDEAFAAGVALCKALQLIVPQALFSIESPKGDHFIHLPGSRELLSDPRWHLLHESHCKTAGPHDRGIWPQKDTDWLVSGVSRNFHLPMCDQDCRYLIPGTRRHKVVLCTGRNNHPEQEVLTDPMVKGRIPLGCFHRIEEAHKDWLCQQRHAYVVEEADSDASTGSEEANSDIDDSELAQPDAQAPLDEAQINDEGQIIGEQVQPLRSEVPTLAVEPTGIKAWALAYPGLAAKGRWDISVMQPGSLWFVDIIVLDFKVTGKKQGMLVCWDIVGGGIRVRPLKRKADAGIEFDKIITSESLDKRGYKVTISGDGCGAVGGKGDGGGLVKNAAFARKLDFYPLEPNRPQLNPVEGLIAAFKADVACVLLPAIKGGGIDESHICLAAEYVSATVERFAQDRDYRKGDHRSPFELNTGVAPDVSRMVPFGMAGYAYVPAEVRKRRGAPKYERSEPVLMIGYQHVYSMVYKCLTRHNTIIHTSQVRWMPGQDLGVFPGLKQDAPALITEPRLDTDLFDKSKVSSENQAKPAKTTSSRSRPDDEGVIRLNRDKVYDAKGDPNPKPYILDRIVAVDGCTVKEAVMLKFPDKSGKDKRYSGDIAYDVATGWIRIELLGQNGNITGQVNSVTANCKDDAEAVQTSKPLFTRVIWPCHPHPDGLESRHVSRRVTRAVRHSLRYRGHPRSVNRLRGRRMPRRVLHEHRKGPITPQAYLNVNDLPWKPYLKGEHKEDILKAYENEINSLLSTVLRELKPGDPEWDAAVVQATTCRAILAYKRAGVWKARVVVHGHKEDREALDGPGFNYSSDVVGMAAIRAMLLGPRLEDEVIAQIDISTAFLQSDMFPEDAPPRYLSLREPTTGVIRYFRQLGNVYGSASACMRWQKTLHPFLVSCGFEQGRNEPCVFRHKKLGVTLASYVDDLLVKGSKPAVTEALRLVQERFKCKEPTFLGENSPIDHLGMYIEETKNAVFLSMHDYIDGMVVKLGMEGVNPGRVQLPICKPIEDQTPASHEEGKWLLRACGCLGWLAGTGRPDVRLAHSRISQYMANPTKGAIEAARTAIKYCVATRTMCLWQRKGVKGTWKHYSDSDLAGNAEPGNKRRSQMGYVSTYGDAPIGWGSKVSSVMFDSASESLPSRGVSNHPCNTPKCHPGMSDLHADVSSGAAEVYAASVTLSETLHLSYVTEEMGLDMPKPLSILVDNAAAIAFSKGQVRRSKLKHIDVRQEWVQAVRDEQICQMDKVDTTENLADFFTKILDVTRFTFLREKMMTEHQCVTDDKVLLSTSTGQ